MVKFEDVDRVRHAAAATRTAGLGDRTHLVP